MSKKKNPLKDLDMFLKQQASSLVDPTPLSELVAKEIKEEKSSATAKPVQVAPNVSDDLMKQLSDLALSDKRALYDLLIELAEMDDSPENAMLINTVLYLKNGDNWQEAVRQYWRNR